MNPNLHHDDEILSRPFDPAKAMSKAEPDERLGVGEVTAIRQLLYANPDHDLPNFVVLVNRDADAIASLLARILNLRLSRKEIGTQDWRAKRVLEEVEKFLVDVDICLWVDSLAGENFSVSGYFLLNPQLAAKVRKWTGRGEDKRIFLQPAA